MSHDPAAISADQESHPGHHKLLNTIGRGSFANMRLGQHILTEYCHQRGIVPRDWKAENVPFDAYGNAEIVGFGLSSGLTTAYAYQSLLETYWIIMDKGLRVAELPGTTEAVTAGTGGLMGRQSDLNSR
ncbi:hypothetical protein HJG60_008643 [Phyllostomus discolor]|uniref:Uncharacterized protein n=1 Tax=Phyllostomus discolor TaxID=89673 RepID=A0A834DKH4_9CHIR|nr:hypothetical protein HJG60_008643 [Phyllostomus discolor]